MKGKFLLIPLAGIVLWIACVYSSVRPSLIARGHPFAQIVPKRQLGHHIFDYVNTDLMQAEAIVFSHGHAIGWVLHDMEGFVQYVPFDGSRSFEPSESFLWELLRNVWLLLAILSAAGALMWLFTTRRGRHA